MQEPIRVAVYGTLKAGGHNHRLLERGNAKFVDNAVTKGTMYDLGPYPAVSLHGEQHQVHVEIYEVDMETFANLDRLEGYPSFYNRDKVETSKGPAWMYTINSIDASTNRVVKSGNWPVAAKDEEMNALLEANYADYKEEEVA